MTIDYVVDYGCPPKEALTTEGILSRLKNRERVQVVIRLYRDHGDNRPPSEMGFELMRRTSDGRQETVLVMVQDLLDEIAELDPLEPFCVGCPANVTGSAYGCTGTIHYPISAAAEQWLLDRLPSPEQPLIWLLLRQGVQEMGYTGSSVQRLRPNPVYFEEQRVRGRDMVEFVITADQVFEMIFMLGHIQPVHAAMLLLFFDAIPRDLEADQLVAIMEGKLTTEEITRDFPFHLSPEAGDDKTITQFKAFFRALYTAWSLNVQLLLDV